MAIGIDFDWDFVVEIDFVVAEEVGIVLVIVVEEVEEELGIVVVVWMALL